MWRSRGDAIRLAIVSCALLSVAPAIAKEELRDAPWRDTEIEYEHSLALIGNDGMFVYGHRLDLRPSVHLGYWLELKARFLVVQDLYGTPPADNSLRPSNLLLALATPGVTEPFSGIKISGGIHVILPTSKAAQTETLIFGAGPSVEVSRTFPLLEGVTVGYRGRWTWDLNKYTTSTECSGMDCTSLLSLNNWAMLAHGPFLRFSPLRKLALEASLLFVNAFLSRESTSIPDSVSWQLFKVSVGYQVVDALRISVGVCNEGNDVLPETSMDFSSTRSFVRVFLSLTFTPDALIRGF